MTGSEMLDLLAYLEWKEGVTEVFRQSRTLFKSLRHTIKSHQRESIQALKDAEKDLARRKKLEAQEQKREAEAAQTHQATGTSLGHLRQLRINQMGALDFLGIWGP
ncbi:hypothetical protein BDW22DRAFT_1349064 [Trametopsis cervina]|nr:hypothetical protein BDW22DRAFT_1349064 [Trametopsis cervina]